MPRKESMAMNDPTYHTRRLEYLRNRRRLSGHGRRYANAIIRLGYYAPIDCKGRLLMVEGLWIMTYPELVDRCRCGYLSPGLLLEQADTSGNTIGIYRMEIADGKPILIAQEA